MAPDDRDELGLLPVVVLPSTPGAALAGRPLLEATERPARTTGGVLPLVAVIVMGCVGLLMLGVQPVILGGLQSAGRISIHDIGLAATLEMLMLGVVSAVLAAKVEGRGLKAWAAGGCLLVALANFAGMEVQGLWFALTRGVAGAGGGILIWIAIAMITSRADAPRVNAIFLGAQAVSQAAFAALIPLTGATAHGALGGLAALSGLAVVTTPLLLLLPSRAASAHGAGEEGGRLTAPGFAGLVAAFLLMAGIVGLWVYVEPIAGLHRIGPQLVSLAVAASLVAQVIGAVFMVTCERWLKPLPGLLVVAFSYLAIAGLLGWSPSPAVFFVATLAFGFLWTVGMALLLPLSIQLDSRRRAAMFLPGAQLLGSSAGPFLAGALASDTNVLPAVGASGAIFAALIMITLATMRIKAPTAPASPLDPNR